MSVVQCPHCQARMRVAQASASGRYRCVKCGQVFSTESGAAQRASAPKFPGAGAPGGAPGAATAPMVAQQAPMPADSMGTYPGASFSQPGRPGGYGTAAGGMHQGYMEPHRGGMILALGLLGLLVFPLLGIPAWIMGREDLKKMDQGRMDPSGRGQTTAGMTMGIIAVVVMVLAVLAFCMVAALVILGAAAAG